MTQAIESVEAVRYARVDFDAKRAEVQSSDCSMPVLEAISKALDDDSYGGTVVEIRPSETP